MATRILPLAKRSLIIPGKLQPLPRRLGVHQRTLHVSTMTQDYLLSRDSYESKRLEKGHVIWTKCLGYTVSPRVMKSLPKSGVNIAEFATGTGVWAIDVAKQMRESGRDAKVTGFDISDQQFTPKSQLPPNVELTIGNIKESFPKELHGSFDLIHVRLLLLAMENDEWAAVVKNVSTLLKPGGWLQWSEIDPHPMTNVLRNTDEECETAALKEGFAYLINSVKHRVFDAHEFLDQGFKQAGLVNIRTDAVGSDRFPEDREFVTGLITGVVMGVGKQRVAEGIKDAWSLEKLEKYHKAMDAEAAKGAYVNFNIASVEGQKPS